MYSIRGLLFRRRNTRTNTLPGDYEFEFLDSTIVTQIDDTEAIPKSYIYDAKYIQLSQISTQSISSLVGEYIIFIFL